MSPTQAGPEAGPACVVPELPDDTQLWLLRHGETEWSASGRHTGVTDVPLTDAGETQARALAGVLSAVRPALVVSSPRGRAIHTAELAGLHVDETSDDLAEWDYGDYEGMTSEQIHETVPDWTIFTHGAPGGESVEQVQARADRVLARTVPRLAGGPVVLVGHGHFTRVLGARWIGLPAADGARLILDTAALSMLGAEHGTAALAQWNRPNPAS